MVTQQEMSDRAGRGKIGITTKNEKKKGLPSRGPPFLRNHEIELRQI